MQANVDEIVADHGFEVTVLAPASDGTATQLGVFGAVNSTLLTGPLIDGSVSFAVPAEATRQRGSITLVATVLGTSSSPINVVVQPGRPSEPVVPLVGPRTIVADGADRTMITVSPADQFGNALADDTAVSTVIVDTQGASQTVVVPVDGGVAAHTAVSYTHLTLPTICSV